MTDLILALDVPDSKQAYRIAEQCASEVDAIKIGYPLVLSAGLGIAAGFADLGLPLIADFKVADIPNTNRLICEQVFAAGFEAVIAHGFTGSDAARACVEVAHSNGGECYLVAEMSHPGATEFFHAGTAERICALAIGSCADGIIAPATRPDRVASLREIVGDRKIYSPGVGNQGGDADRIAGLVDGIIVGRTIYEAADPKAAARQFSHIRR